MTNSVLKNGHIEADELIDYFASALAPARQLEIEEHAAGCELCAESCRDIYSLVFEVQRLSTGELAQAFANRSMASALTSAAESEDNAEVKRTFHESLRRLGRSSAGAFKAIVRSSGAEFLFENFRAGGDWKMSPEFALRGGTSEPIDQAQRAILEIPGAKTRSTVSLHRRGSEVSLEVSGWPENSQPVAIFVDLSDAGSSTCGLTTHVEGNDYEISFPRITSGPYLLLFESVEKWNSRK